VGPPVDIGTAGDGINAGADGPADWAGATILHGDFVDDGVQDVMAYYTTGPSAGNGVIIGGSGGPATLDPYAGNTATVTDGLLCDPTFDGCTDNPSVLVAAGDASQEATGLDDLIGILGDPMHGYELDLYSTSAPGLYGYDATLSTAEESPDATTDWDDYSLATAELPDVAFPRATRPTSRCSPSTTPPVRSTSRSTPAARPTAPQAPWPGRPAPGPRSPAPRPPGAPPRRVCSPPT